MKKFNYFIFSTLLLSSAVTYAAPPEGDLDVAIIGGGFSGLSAAIKIKKDTKNFVIFEGRDRLGGRAWTQIINEKPFDCGAEYVDKKEQNEMWQLIKRYGVKTTDVRLQDEIKFLVGGEAKALSEMKSAIDSLEEKLHSKLKSIRNEDYSELKNGEYISTNLFQALDLNENEKGILNALIQDESGINGDEAPLTSISAWAEKLKEYKSITTAKKWFNPLLSLYHEQSRIEGGTKTLVQEMAKEIGQDDHIVTGNPLKQIVWQSDEKLFNMTFQDNSTRRAKSVLMTIPFSVLSENTILEDTSLGITNEMRKYIDSMVYGTNSKVIVPVSTPLKLTYGIDLNGPTAWANANQDMHILLGGTPGKNVTQESASIHIGRFLTATGKIMPQGQQATVINWSQDPFSKGSYRAWKSGVTFSEFDHPSPLDKNLNAFSTSLFEKKIPLIFAGEHMVYRGGGTMNSAVKTGFATADLMSQFLKKK
ncbi:FAD-dependent oxidoreductase (plasmid) [Candidatus Bealeia paramacronuclearis]|uniref:Tryptophan 2-monooxygenase n=1 Tax=Candidatus Bealeia paramacronuclearis TaxID=1921001 RepID=A0ABZ2C2U5_9PROT|nr:FAD-dependent oxidoreductase [Candidatus Bealeia paramacronuclearis]MEB3703194.1 hypothetical protein [Candidatus Bealeia paramacronuclearis]